MTTIALVILLLVVGLILIAIEVLVIPGFGVIGVLGILATVGGVVMAWMRLGSAYGMLAITAGVVVTAAMLYLLPKTRAGRALVLDAGEKDMRAGDPRLRELAGMSGHALTALHPAGTADVGGRTVDVVTDGVYVDAGRALRVVRVEGSRVVVEVLEEKEPS
jgi:membrane-bound ClpP family serine protease